MSLTCTRTRERSGNDPILSETVYAGARECGRKRRLGNQAGVAQIGGKPHRLVKARAVMGSPASCSQGFTLTGGTRAIVNVAYMSSREMPEKGDVLV